MDPALDRTNLEHDNLYRGNLYATGAFTLAAIVSSAFPGPLRIPFAVFSCILFAIGTIAFLWAYAVSVNRSREEDVSVVMVYGMTVVPKEIRRRFHLLTFAQSVVAIAAASIHPFTAQAFGILAPMLGLGLAGLYAARNGTFDERKDGRYKARQANLAIERSQASKSTSDKNESNG